MPDDEKLKTSSSFDVTGGILTRRKFFRVARDTAAVTLLAEAGLLGSDYGANLHLENDIGPINEILGTTGLDVRRRIQESKTSLLGLKIDPPIMLQIIDQRVQDFDTRKRAFESGFNNLPATAEHLWRLNGDSLALIELRKFFDPEIREGFATGASKDAPQITISPVLPETTMPGVSERDYFSDLFPQSPKFLEDSSSIMPAVNEFFTYKARSRLEALNVVFGKYTNGLVRKFNLGINNATFTEAVPETGTLTEGTPEQIGPLSAFLKKALEFTLLLDATSPDDLLSSQVHSFTWLPLEAHLVVIDHLPKLISEMDEQKLFSPPGFNNLMPSIRGAISNMSEAEVETYFGGREHFNAARKNFPSLFQTQTAEAGLTPKEQAKLDNLERGEFFYNFRTHRSELGESEFTKRMDLLHKRFITSFISDGIVQTINSDLPQNSARHEFSRKFIEALNPNQKFKETARKLRHDLTMQDLQAARNFMEAFTQATSSETARHDFRDTLRDRVLNVLMGKDKSQTDESWEDTVNAFVQRARNGPDATSSRIFIELGRREVIESLFNSETKDDYFAFLLNKIQNGENDNFWSKKADLLNQN